MVVFVIIFIVLHRTTHNGGGGRNGGRVSCVLSRGINGFLRHALLPRDHKSSICLSRRLSVCVCLELYFPILEARWMVGVYTT